MFQQVADFHRAFGQLVADTPSLPDPDVRAMRERLLIEECDELADAEKANDLVGIADALADICYIISGTLVSYGTAFRLAPPEFKDAIIPDEVPPYLPPEQVRKKVLENAQKHLAAYLAAEQGDDVDVIDTKLRRLLEHAVAYAYLYGIPLGAVFDEVHGSNMTKLGSDGKPVYRADGKVLKGPKYRPPDIAAILARRS